jgi:hypothetical protein
MAKKRIVTRTSVKDLSGAVTGRKKTVTKLDRAGNIKKTKEVFKGDKGYITSKREAPVLKAKTEYKNRQINEGVKSGLIKPKTAEKLTKEPVTLSPQEKKQARKEPVVKARKFEGDKSSVYSKTVEKRGKNSGAVIKSRTVSKTARPERGKINQRIKSVQEEGQRAKKKREEETYKLLGR